MNDFGVSESKRLEKEFLESIPETEKQALLKKANEITPAIENVWRAIGHTPEWINEPHLDTGRNVNRPNDETFFITRDAYCSTCKFNMKLIVHTTMVVIHGGGYRCTPRQQNSQ
jgi:hypothetical protein